MERFNKGFVITGLLSIKKFKRITSICILYFDWSMLPDIMLITGVDHVYEFLLVSTPGNQVITHGEVPLPPRPLIFRSGNHGIFVWR